MYNTIQRHIVALAHQFLKEKFDFKNSTQMQYLCEILRIPGDQIEELLKRVEFDFLRLNSIGNCPMKLTGEIGDAYVEFSDIESDDPFPGFKIVLELPGITLQIIQSNDDLKVLSNWHFTKEEWGLDQKNNINDFRSFDSSMEFYDINHAFHEGRLQAIEEKLKCDVENGVDVTSKEYLDSLSDFSHVWI